MIDQQLISVVASLAAAVSAIATLLTVLEMKRQRQAANHPELVLPTLSITGTAVQAGQHRIPSQWSTSKGTEPPGFHAPVSVPLINIGLGAAKNLEVAWELPIESFGTQINQMAQRAFAKALIEVKDGNVIFRSDETIEWASIWKNQTQARIAYSLPASAGGGYATLTLPDAYVQMVSAYLHFFVLCRLEVPEFEIPSMTVSLMFQDVSGNQLEKTLETNLTPSFIQAGKFNATLTFTATA